MRSPSVLFIRRRWIVFVLEGDGTFGNASGDRNAVVTSSCEVFGLNENVNTATESWQVRNVSAPRDVVCVSTFDGEGAGRWIPGLAGSAFRFVLVPVRTGLNGGPLGACSVGRFHRNKSDQWKIAGCYTTSALPDTVDQHGVQGGGRSRRQKRLTAGQLA